MPPSSSRIPPLLQPYVRLPPASSLHLLTSVLGASTNWLVIRYLCGAFAGHDARKPAASSDEINSRLRGQDEDAAVILVSFMRDWEFWKTESRRAGVSMFIYTPWTHADLSLSGPRSRPSGPAEPLCLRRRTI